MNVSRLVQYRPDPRTDALERMQRAIERLKNAMRHENDLGAIAALEEIDANYQIIYWNRP